MIGNWDNEIHFNYKQVGCMERGIKLKGKYTNLKTDEVNPSMTITGSSGEEYYVTLNNCTCHDFESRGLPCKHIYALANELGLLDEDVFPPYKKNRKASKILDEDIEKYEQYYRDGIINQAALVEVCKALNRAKTKNK